MSGRKSASSSTARLNKMFDAIVSKARRHLPVRKSYKDALVQEARKAERIHIERNELPHSRTGRAIVDIVIAVERGLGIR